MMKVNKYVIFLFCLIIFLTPFTVGAELFNGFDISNAKIDKHDIMSGGPPRDGIPAIDQPKFIPVDQVDFLQEDDIIIGLNINGIRRAYPTRILVWHEIVNDVLGNKAIAVTYCPLCGTGMVFDRMIAGEILTFGVSGLLYQSDVLMYDRQTESLWSQLGMEAVSGPLLGKKLTWLPMEHLTWEAWRQKYPEGQVLSTDTGHARNYAINVYSSYMESEDKMFPVPNNRSELPDKEWVIGVIVNGTAKAYPISELENKGKVSDLVGEEKISVEYDKSARSHTVLNSEDEQLPSVLVFWFAWQAFYPETELWE